MERPLGAQISHMLKSRGVDVIFGIPGVHNQEMYRGIEEAGLTHVLARHEQGAAFMADGYARATGKPGICYVITGPGVLNALTPLGQAYSDSVPVLMLASCLDETAFEKGQLHQMRDQEGAAETVCDWSETAMSATAAYGLIDRALTEFETMRRRPKAIHVPIRLLEASASAAPSERPAVTRMQGAGAAVEQFAALLHTAERPLIIAGGGCTASGSAVVAVAEAAGAASFTTYAARGVFAPDSPLHFGANLSRPGSADVIAQADLVVAIGTELAEVDLWRPKLGHEKALVRVDIDPQMLNSRPGTALAICGDAGAVLEDLLPRLDGSKSTGWREEDVSAARARWRTEVISERPGLAPLIEAVRQAVPSETMVYSDMTQFAYAAKDLWDMEHPGHWHHPFGFGTLGYALPAAIGGAVARKGQPTLCMIGDYGLQYTVAELGTAVELGLSLPILLWDNGKLGEIEESMVRAQIAPNAVIQRNPDFLGLARAYGVAAVQPGSGDELQSAIGAAFKADVPTLIRMTPDLLDGDVT